MNTSKFFALLCAAVLCAALLYGCTKAPETEERTPTSPELTNPAVNIDGPAYTGTEIADSPYVGKFDNSYSAQFASDAADVYVNIILNEDGTSTYEPVERPSLDCRADGTFSLTVMTTLGGDYATLTGTYTVDGEHAEFTVTPGAYGDFLGADTEKFSGKLLGADEIRYWGDQIGTVMGGDIFRRAA